MKYWLVGYNFGSDSSQFDRFIELSIWEGGFIDSSTSGQRQIKYAQSIKKGDVLILKSTSTKGKPLKGFLRVSAVAKVLNDVVVKKENGMTLCTCETQYYGIKDVDFDSPSLSSYRSTIHPADSKAKAVIDYANSIICDNETPQYKEYIDLLKGVHNLVLTGAPGTGKTYMAHVIAKKMGAEIKFVQFHPSYDYTDFVEGLRPTHNKKDGQIGFERVDGVFKAFCKEALMYSFDTVYTAFIEDIRSKKIKTIKTKVKESSELYLKGGDNIYWYSKVEKDNVSSNSVSRERLWKLYRVYNTIEKLESMKNIHEEIKSVIGGCDTTYYWAVLNYILPKIRPFVFIIDEINRGEASKILGELFYAIDPGYRGKKDCRVQTQYQNLVPKDDVFADGFYVPENVYILATMNDIDRSVESMDFAMRRRFTWKEVTPNDTETMLAGFTCAEEAKARMSRLNEVISTEEGLGSAYMIGPAYFLKLKDNGEDFKKLWILNIEPLLKEYLRGHRKHKEILDKFYNAYFNESSVSPTKQQS